MKPLLLLFLTFALVAWHSVAPGKEPIPQLELVASLEQDSLLYAAGFRQMGVTVSQLIAPSYSPAQFTQNLARLKRLKCKVYLCNVLFPGKMKIAGPAVNPDRVVAYADSVFDRAHQAGVPLLVLGSGGARRLPDGYGKQQAQADFVVLCRRLAGAAQKHGVMLALESLNSSETNFLNTLQESAEVVRTVRHPNFRLNADIYHMLREGESPQQIVAAKDLLVHCEIAEKQTRSFPGVQGEDFKPYLRALRQARYQGPIFIEGVTQDPKTDIPRAFTYLTQQLREVYAEK